MKGLVETNNISYNPENANEPNLSASSPIQPPDLDSSTFESRVGSRHLDRGHFIREGFGENNDPHIPYNDHDRKSDIDPRVDLSPITDQPSRKRRKVSSCDTPSLPLQSSLSRHLSESQVSHSPYKLIPSPPTFILKKSGEDDSKKRKINHPLHVNTLTSANRSSRLRRSEQEKLASRYFIRN